LAQTLTLLVEEGDEETGMGAVRQIIGATGLIFAAIFAASY
jgi:hypothetical protein